MLTSAHLLDAIVGTIRWTTFVGDVTKDVYVVVLAYDAVPSIDHVLVHLIGVLERSLAVLDDVLVP